MIGWDLRTDWAYENDAFCLQANLGWATQIGAETARLAGDAEAFAAFYAASRALPWNGAQPVRPDFMERHGRHTHYHAWLAHRDDAAYWRSLSPAAQASDAAIPMLFVGGWYNSHLPGTLAAFKHYAAKGVPARLVVGPWPHMPWGRRLAGTDFGREAAGLVDRLQLRWFDHWLKGRTPDFSPSRRSVSSRPGGTNGGILPLGRRMPPNSISPATGSPRSTSAPAGW